MLNYLTEPSVIAPSVAKRVVYACLTRIYDHLLSARFVRDTVAPCHSAEEEARAKRIL